MVPSLVLERWPSRRQRGRADLYWGKRAAKPGGSLEVLLSRRLTRGVLAHAEHLHQHLPVARAHQEPQHKAEGDFGTPLPRPWQSFRWQSRSRHEASGAPCLQAAVQIPSRISLNFFFFLESSHLRGECSLLALPFFFFFWEGTRKIKVLANTMYYFLLLLFHILCCLSAHLARKK